MCDLKQKLLLSDELLVLNMLLCLAHLLVLSTSNICVISYCLQCYITVICVQILYPGSSWECISRALENPVQNLVFWTLEVLENACMNPVECILDPDSRFNYNSDWWYYWGCFSLGVVCALLNVFLDCVGMFQKDQLWLPARYPHELAWQLDLDRKLIRQNDKLKRLHQFLIQETESVCMLAEYLHRINYLLAAK